MRAMTEQKRRAMQLVTQASEKLVRPLAVAAAAGMWVVLIMGATVTNTGSQTGCGPSWPLCRGRFIPQFAVSTFIEFSHRAVVGVESVLVIGFAITAWVLYRDHAAVRILAPTMVLFLFLQAGLGAWAVMAPQEAAVLALHFGVSLVAFASVLLTAIVVFETENSRLIRNRPLPPGFAAYVWTVTIFSYAVVYLGAYVRHRGAEDACSGWPLCNGRVVPVMSGMVGPAFGHRLAALVLVIGVGGLVAWTARFREARPDLFRAAMIAAALVILQALSGALVQATGMDLFSALAHAGLVALLFGCLSYLCLQVSRQPAEARSRARVQRAAEPAH
jgi:heme a synthase